MRDKLGELQRCGIDQCLILPFNARFASQSPQDFIQQVLLDGLGVRYVLVGDDFRFGAKRAGDYDMLVTAGETHGFDVARMNSYEISDPRPGMRGGPSPAMPPFRHGRLRVSSSAVREVLGRGAMNEVAQLCERMGADVDMVRRGIGSDDRIGKRFLFPGIGYGGSCFPKDVQALIMSSDEVNYDFEILKAVEKVNALQKLSLVEKISSYYKGQLKGKHIALWGLAFKPNTDDIREAPALSIIDALVSMGATITAYDPEAMPNVKAQIGDKIQYAQSQYEALTGADFLIIATEWSEFRTPDFERIEKEIKNKIIFDGRNLFEVAKMKELGYHYVSIGRPSATK